MPEILFDLLLALQLAVSVAQLSRPTPSPPEPDSLVIVAAGDLMLASWLVPVLDREGLDYPYRNLRAVLDSADLCVVNLEAPFTDGGTPFDKRFTFRVPTRLAPSLLAGSVDAVHLANNHILDYGPEGLRTTLALLDSLGILHFGAGADIDEACSATVARVRGKTVALLGYSLTYPEEFYAGPGRPGTCFGSARAVEAAIRAVRDSVDLVIVSFHWGAELMEVPKPYQRALAHLAIDSGADLVVGHHPHVLQGFEIYRGKLIAYSLGNYVFASYSDRARRSALLRCTFDADSRLAAARVIPLNVWNREVEFQPRILEGREASQLFAHLNAISSDLNDGAAVVDELGYIRLRKETITTN